jgi:micrococcal nuclease
MHRRRLSGLITSLILITIVTLSCTQTPSSQTSINAVKPTIASQTKLTTTIIIPYTSISTKSPTLPTTIRPLITTPTTTVLPASITPNTTATPTMTLTPATTATTTMPTITVIATATTPTTTIVTIGEATVVRVIDGDTIEVSINGKIYTVRYIGINTPETTQGKKEPFGQEATNKNSELVNSRIVRLEKDVRETDDFGRLLRYVYVGNLFINAELVRLGYARATPYPPDVKYQELFSSLEQQAKGMFLGMWAKKYVGSKNSTKYHLPSCSWAKEISTENQVWFYSVADAQAKGYVPCGVCKPPTSD